MSAKYVVTAEEGTVLSEALPEYLNLPDQSPERRECITRTVDRLVQISDTARAHWNEQNVRQWFMNHANRNQ